MGYDFTMDRSIAKILAARPFKTITRDNFVPSAVLLLLLESSGKECILFTKRSDTVDCHQGEISFPGGKVEACDVSLLQAALREAEEEIGLCRQNVAILGRLDDVVTTTTGFVVTSYVGRIPYPYAFRINQDEIAELVVVPLERLAAGCVPHTSGAVADQAGISGPFFRYKGHIIWGATARIVKQFLDITSPTRDKDYRDTIGGARGRTRDRSRDSDVP
jgi:8-oxo-dGTP pyrophosphatase MutT (NUDIX family)